jgi:hypothetical protein
MRERKTKGDGDGTTASVTVAKPSRGSCSLELASSAASFLGARRDVVDSAQETKPRLLVELSVAMCAQGGDLPR